MCVVCASGFEFCVIGLLLKGVHCTTLKWEHGCQWQPDIVVGADVVYDPDAVPCLCGVVSSVLSSRHGAGSEPCQDGGQGVAYILNVVRNPATFEKFTDAAAQRGLAIEDISEELVGMHMKFQFPPCQYQQSAFVMHRLSLKH
ncbi:unnamed protein product [Ostreobium quekettii]|uniref:Uncharacterized protein n=1 Tax=Ostreobium quekettii TaxID=121088 RepID=A0A8S1IKI7_9CHLO|nr:unnamed protein product [Ostreobium quekettii]